MQPITGASSRLPDPDDIVLFACDSWCFYGDINSADWYWLETMEHSFIKFESARWHELVTQEERS